MILWYSQTLAAYLPNLYPVLCYQRQFLQKSRSCTAKQLGIDTEYLRLQLLVMPELDFLGVDEEVSTQHPHSPCHLQSVPSQSVTVAQQCQQTCIYMDLVTQGKV